MRFKDLIHKSKKILSITLALVMVLGFLPANVVKASASDMTYVLIPGCTFFPYGEYKNPSVWKDSLTINKDAKDDSNIILRDSKYRETGQVTIHKGENCAVKLPIISQMIKDAATGKWPIYISLSPDKYVPADSELEIVDEETSHGSENSHYVKTEGTGEYPSKPARFTYDLTSKMENGQMVDTYSQFRFKVKALKKDINKPLYVFRVAGSKKQKKLSHYRLYKLTVCSDRGYPDANKVQMYRDNDESIPVSTIPIIKGMKTTKQDSDENDTIIQEASTMTLHPALLDGEDAHYTYADYDRVEYRLAGTGSDYFELTQDENSNQISITEKKSMYGSEGNDSIKAYLEISYITWDKAFKDIGTRSELKDVQDGKNNSGYFYDEQTNSIKFKVIKYIPIEFSDNLDNISPIKYKFKHAQLYSDDIYTNIKTNTLVLTNRVSRAYTQYDSIHVNDGFEILDISLGGEDVKNYITKAKVITQDEYETHGFSNNLMYKAGECVLEYENYENGGKERTSGTPARDRAYIKLKIKGPGGVIYTPTLYISVPHPVYKLNNGNVHLTIQGDRKENKNINLTGVVDKKEFIKLNRGQEYKTVDNVAYDYEKTQFKVSSSDTVSNVCDVDMYGNIQAKNPGTATIKVTLPPTEIFANRYANFDAVGPMHTWRRENGTNYYLFKTATGYDESTSYSTLKMSDMVQSIAPTCTINVVVTEIAEDLKFPEADYENNYRKVAIGSKINYQPIVYPTGNNHFVSKQFEWYSDNPEVANVDATTGEVTALKVGKTTIHATTTDGSDLDASYEITVVTKAPTNITCKNKADGVQLSWDSNKSATSYNVYRRDTQSGEATEVGKDVNATTFTDTTAQFDKTYYYSITCNAGMGKDFESNESSLIKHKYEVATPTIDSVKLSGSSATITITGTKFKGYVLYYGTSEKASNMIGTTTSKETTINLKEVDGLASNGKLKGGTYYFRAKAYATKENEDGDAKNYYSGYSNSVKLTIQSTDSGGTVAPITVNKDGSLTVKVTAKKVNSAKKYQIRFYKTKKNAKKNKKAVVKKTSKKRKFKINISKKTLKKKKLTKTKKLYYRIRAKKGNKWKKWSKVKSVKIK